MYKIIVYNKMNSRTREINSPNVQEAITKARRIAKAIGKNGGWTMVETDNFEKITFFDYTPF